MNESRKELWHKNVQAILAGWHLGMFLGMFLWHKLTLLAQLSTFSFFFCIKWILGQKTINHIIANLRNTMEMYWNYCIVEKVRSYLKHVQYCSFTQKAHADGHFQFIFVKALGEKSISNWDENKLTLRTAFIRRQEMMRETHDMVLILGLWI